MKSSVIPDAETLDDARLVELGVDGNRDAFGQLVARYQSALCALAYSACGNISQSEDLAQETFIIAWRKLRDLKEPAKFKSWLFGIARNRIHDTFRQRMRNPLAGAEPWDESVAAATATVSNPAGHAISKEEEEILWRSLAQVPESYREPLVLFYREQQSIERVAAILELSEDATRQRLSRGRKLLQEQVMAFVEGALVRTNPGQAFTLAVLAALPVSFAASAKAATVAATAAKGGAAATGASFLSVLGALLGPFIGLGAGYLGMRASLKSTRTPRERAMMVRHNWIIIGAVIAFFAACTSLNSFAALIWKLSPALVITLGMAMVIGYAVFILIAAFRFGRTFARLREEERQRHPELYQEQVPGLFATSWFSTPHEYRSRATLFGLPLVHYRMGRLAGQKMQPAIGWIACGEVAYGILYASGGIAVGGISTGGVSIGIIAFGGFSIGLLAFGGLAIGGIALGGGAIGLVATGGLAIAWHAGTGGLVAAHDLAVGGLALANHANDAVARAFFMRYRWLDFTRPASCCLFWALCFGPIFLQILGWNWWRRKMAKKIMAGPQPGANC